ncbi:hypothetical protein HDU98_011543 [Podochytrium sp. JEL0797]|nr:hypothetical protein HDU98_011543 [Podochytrium sp. JEL0797]
MKRLFRTASSDPAKRDPDTHPHKLARTDDGSADAALYKHKDLLADPDPTTAFQKNAIYRRMLEYRRLYQDSLAKSQSLEDKQRDFDQCLLSFVQCLSQISEDLSMLKGLDDADVKSSAFDSSFIRALVDGSSPSTANQSLDSCRADIRKHISQVAALLHSNRSTPSNDQLDQLQARCHTLSIENSDLKSTTTFQDQRIHDLVHDLETVKAAKIIVERKYDRIKLSNEPPHVSTNSDSNGNSSTQASHPNSAGPSSAPVDFRGATLPNGGDAGSVMAAANAAAASEWETLAQSRLKEVEELKNQKLEISQAFEAFKINNGFQQGEPVVRQSLLSLAEERAEIAQQNFLVHQKRYNDMQMELQELKQEQGKFKEMIEGEELARRKGFESEMKRLELEATRYRTQRDSLQEAFQLQKEKDAFETHQHQEIKFLAGSQKGRIQELESSIERLKMKLVINDTDGFLREFFFGDAMEEGESANGGAGNIFTELKKRLDASEAKALQLEQLLASFESATTDTREKTHILASESSLKSELEKVQAELASLDPAASKLVSELEVKIDFYQKSEARLIHEIEMLSAAWTDLETQNQRKVFNLTEKEDQISRLIAERTKFDQKCEKLTKERNMINNQVIALKRQSERQLEQIRKLEERERLLNIQLQALEKDLSVKTVAADLHRRKVTELNQKQAELVDKLDKLHAKFMEAERVLAEKMKLMSDDAHAQRRLLERIEVLKKKLESQPKTSEMADSYLQQENEDLKLLVKCSACSTNFKSHILTKCMHTFCKSCLDDLVNSRQRKCPKCANPFGHADIRPFYL